MLHRFRLGKGFRTRTPSRDSAEDLKRLKSISDAVQTALLSANDELEGLQKRKESAQHDCSALVGNDTYGEDRDEQVERALVAAEREYMKANRRIETLRAHISALRNIDSLVHDTVTSANDLAKALPPAS
jgi:chromosome segregation ATPase